MNIDEKYPEAWKKYSDEVSQDEKKFLSEGEEPFLFGYVAGCEDSDAWWIAKLQEFIEAEACGDQYPIKYILKECLDSIRKERE